MHRSLIGFGAACGLALAALLSGCGSGGSSSNVAAAPAPAPDPAVTSVTPSTITPPARVTVDGTHLDLVTQARLGATVLTIAAQTATTLALDVPGTASTGFIVLVANGVARQTAAQVTVTGSIGVASLSPAAILTGGTLTVGGSNLDRATGVEFTGGATSPVATHTGTTAITAVVPGGAMSGPVTVLGSAGERAVSATDLVVVPPIVVDANATYTVSAGAPVTLAGTGLSAVNNVTVGASVANIVSKSNTQLVFTPPAGLTCGAITLSSAAQSAVAAGSLVVGSGCNFRSAGIEFAQVLSQPAGDQYQRIVPGKELLVRAYVVATGAGTLAPSVQLTGFSGSTVLGTVAMTGPATLPVLAVGAAVPDSMRYNETQTFNASLPAAWIAAGLNVRVDIGGSVTASATPAVGTPTNIDVVLVPMVSGGNVPTMPDPTAVLDELTRRMPAARGRITVAVRAAYTLTSVTDGVDTDAEWSAALSELETLRRGEAPSKQYYGMAKPMVSAGVAGIGYVNRVGSSSPNLAAFGWDASRTAWRRIMTHEMGHNFSRPHAPCGTAANPDPNYPYAGGVLGTAPLFESLLDDIQSPAGLTDVMGYCSGAWFSDYSWREVQRFLEARPQPAMAVVQSSAAASGVAPVAGDTLLVAGTLDAAGVRFEPVQRLRGAVAAEATGDYRLRVRTADGGLFEFPFDAIEVDHAEPPAHQFFVSLPAPAAAITQIDVVRAGAVVAQRADSRVKTQAAQAVQAPVTPSVAWRETGTRLALAWDPAAAQFVSVTHVLNGVRTTVALHLSGGKADLDVGALPRGGEYEFSLSRGFDAQLQLAPR